MMTVLTWVESHGVRVETDRHRPTTVGDVLSLLELTQGGPSLAIRLTDETGPAAGGAEDTRPPVVRPGDRLTPVLDGPAFRLAPFQPQDIAFLYTLAVHPRVSFRWRYRGAPPSPERFAEELWSHVLVQYVVRRTRDNEPVGHVVAYGADQAVSHAYVGAVFDPGQCGQGLAAGVVAMFVRNLFHTFPLRKLYLEIPGYNWDQLASGAGRLFQVEGVLRDHVYYGGRYWDQHLCAIYPEQLESNLDRTRDAR